MTLSMCATSPRVSSRLWTDRLERPIFSPTNARISPRSQTILRRSADGKCRRASCRSGFSNPSFRSASGGIASASKNRSLPLIRSTRLPTGACMTIPKQHACWVTIQDVSLNRSRTWSRNFDRKKNRRSVIEPSKVGRKPSFGGFFLFPLHAFYRREKSTNHPFRGCGR